ncbi:MAG TPA: MerR family transcriptional regulator [Tenuifilaceae bacterium]|nr:MerR family transcriptional regulator [Tenuifilaceae bacterium]HOZ15787.1 MerR family transcriptional regulator [Tenuifilaceae bacterium]HPI44131.1 MerR family transcriptional regulator [Tenuifilaceae bacterium]HPN21348.1 MerR family transcriptional regulator [Tenuifilaceae bacterium]
MPYKEKKVEKLYYSIGEVADMLKVNTSLIRFWEKNFDIIKPHKNKKGNRYFTKEDIENLKLIYHLVKEQRMTLEGAQKKLSENKQSVSDNYKIIESLTSIKQMLLEIKDQLE